VDFMLLFIDRKDARAGEPAGMAALSEYASELMRKGTLRRAAPLGAESVAARIRVRDGKAFVRDGPFPESKEVVGGFWIVDVPSRDAAVEIAVRAFELGEPRPHARGGVVEVHLARAPERARDSGVGAPFFFAFHMEPGLEASRAKMAEMFEFGAGLMKAGKLVETAPLLTEPAPVRVQCRRGKTIVTDGPFAETKDVVGGYALLRTKDRAEAIEIATRYPHAKWGPVEVRDMPSP
jgi:hypothetical protein